LRKDHPWPLTRALRLTIHSLLPPLKAIDRKIDDSDAADERGPQAVRLRLHKRTRTLGARLSNQTSYQFKFRTTLCAASHSQTTSVGVRTRACPAPTATAGVIDTSRALASRQGSNDATRARRCASRQPPVQTTRPTPASSSIAASAPGTSANTPTSASAHPVSIPATGHIQGRSRSTADGSRNTADATPTALTSATAHSPNIIRSLIVKLIGSLPGTLEGQTPETCQPGCRRRAAAAQDGRVSGGGQRVFADAGQGG
jgi:hypothetical protein